jgi:hypothetical protein
VWFITAADPGPVSCFRIRSDSTKSLFKEVVVDPRGISCVLCNDRIDSVCHLFVICPLLSQVWYHVLRWLLGWEFVLPKDLECLLSILLDLDGG